MVAKSMFDFFLSLFSYNGESEFCKYISGFQARFLFSWDSMKKLGVCRNNNLAVLLISLLSAGQKKENPSEDVMTANF